MSSSGDDPTDGDAKSADASSGGDDGNGDEREWWQRSDPEPPSIGPAAPEVDIPEVEIPGSGDAVGGDVDVDTAKGFWRLVLVFDVALLALALGPMFIYFEGDVRRGGMLVAFGVFVFAYGVARYREFRAETAEDDSAGDESPSDERDDEDGSAGDEQSSDERDDEDGSAGDESPSDEHDDEA